MPHITATAIDVQALLNEVGNPECGGIVLFLGTVRRGVEDGPVTEIEYSAYSEMAEEEFARIIEDAAARWPGARLAARHRVGAVPLGEPSVAVAAAAPHRAQAFDAARFVIDEAKRRLPVWKKERFEDGSSQWRERPSAPAAPHGTAGSS